MTRIAVLMTCYNRVETTLRCLRGLFAQMLPEGVTLDVWLVDDASPDGTGDKVLSWFRSLPSTSTFNLNLIRGSGSLFWCKGMALAWREALKSESGNHPYPNPQSLIPNPYDAFLWLNDDVVLKDDAISGLLADCDKTHGVIVGTFASDETYSDVSYGATAKMPDGEPHKGEKGMNGNLVLIPRGVYEKVGPIYGGYSHGYGDYDYGLMVNEAGLDYYASSRFCGVCPQQPERYIHLDGMSLAQRISALFDPRGFSLSDTFRYRLRHWGFLRAVVSCCHVTAKVLCGRE